MKELVTPIFKTFLELINKTKKYGKSIIFFSLLIITTLLLIMYIIFLNNKIMDSYLDSKKVINDKEHTTQVLERRKLNITIYNLLNRFYYNNNEVKNIALLEYHNGSVNLGKKAFLFASTTFEISNSNNVLINIQKSNMSNYNIFNVLFNNNYYSANLNNLKLTDSNLYYLIKDINGASYVYVNEIRNVNNNTAIAALIVTTTDTTYNESMFEKTKIITNSLNYLFS